MPTAGAEEEHLLLGEFDGCGLLRHCPSIIRNWRRAVKHSRAIELDRACGPA